MTYRSMLWASAAVFFLGTSAVVVGACSDDSTTPATDATLHKDGSGGADLYPDLGALPDVGKKEACETEWIDAIHAQDRASTGQVSTTESAGVKKTILDASAGGMGASAKNPFVYISLTDGTRVDISDIQSKTSKDWDLAFRRAVIRVNGGDSGPGGAAVARISGKTFDEVTAAPAAGAFKADEFIDDNCKIARDLIKNARTVFSTPNAWYDYDMQTSKLTPWAIVWVVRRVNGSFVKMTIDSYYSPSNVGGHFTLSWKAL